MSKTKRKEKQKHKKNIRKLFDKLLKDKQALTDMATYTKIMFSLDKEELSAMLRNNSTLKFIGTMTVYDEILYVLAKDRTKFGKNIFKKILVIRNKIAREYRKDRRLLNSRLRDKRTQYISNKAIKYEPTQKKAEIEKED